MLQDRKHEVQTIAKNIRLRRQITEEYGAFLRILFSTGDWFVTITLRDREQDSKTNGVANFENRTQSVSRPHTQTQEKGEITRCARDPRLDSWEPHSKYHHEPGPPVRDAALRELEHWLLELGWEASGHKRQELFERLADGLSGLERRAYAKPLCKRCLCCELINDPVTTSFFYEMRNEATAAIGWVIAEEFGRAGGRWHVHLLIRGVQHLRRKKWWKRAFDRFGRSRIEPIHG